jgi:5-methylcytosine-specific restriction endonuclease McrA
MSTYSELLRDPRWQRRRNEILILDDYACVLCGNAQDNLQVHHCRYRKGASPWDYPDHELITTCEPCHQKLSGKIERKVAQVVVGNVIAVTKKEAESFWAQMRRDLASQG